MYDFAIRSETGSRNWCRNCVCSSTFYGRMKNTCLKSQPNINNFPPNGWCSLPHISLNIWPTVSKTWRCVIGAPSHII